MESKGLRKVAKVAEFWEMMELTCLEFGALGIERVSTTMTRLTSLHFETI